MATFYAYTPTADGGEPLGIDRRGIRHDGDLSTKAGAIRWALRCFGASAVVLRCNGRFSYRDSDWAQIHPRVSQ